MSGEGHLVDSFLEMMSAERGAAANTIAAYGRDLADYLGFLAERTVSPLAASREDIVAYLARLETEGLGAASSARRLSALRQFCRFLVTDNLRADDPTRIVARPRTQRPLPKVLSVAEVGRLLGLAESEANAAEAPAGALRLYVLLELLYATGLRGGAVEQPAGFGLAHDLRQRAVLARAVQRAGWIVGPQPFGVEKLVELPQRRQLARLRARCESAAGNVGEVDAQFGGAGFGDAHRQPLGGILEIASIGLQRVVAGAALGAHHFEEGFDAG